MWESGKGILVPNQDFVSYWVCLVVSRDTQAVSYQLWVLCEERCGKSAHLARNASLTSYVLKNALWSVPVRREPEITLFLVRYLFLAQDSTLS